MKSKLIKLISCMLILTFLVSAFAVFAFAEEDGEKTEILDTLHLFVNRNFEEGWDVSNGLGGQYKGQSFTVDKEELADFSFNHFARVEVLEVPATGSDGFIALNDNQIVTGGTVLEYDMKVDCYTNTGNGYFLSPYTDTKREYVDFFKISENKYVIYNGTALGNSKGSIVVGSLADEWVHIANVYNFDQNLRGCATCSHLYYLTEPAENNYEIPVTDHCPNANCGAYSNYYVYTIETYFGYADTFDWKNAICINEDGLTTFDLNNTYVFDSYRILTSGGKPRINEFRIGTTGVKAGAEGQSFLLDNVKFYNNITPVDENGNPTLMTIRDDITVETHGYGSKVDENKAPTIEIEGGSSAFVNYLDEAMIMKVNCDYMYFNETRSPIFKSRKTGKAYGAPIKIDGVVYIPFEPLLDATGYPVFIHDDGIQYDISTAGGASILTLYRDSAIVNGERVPLTAAPFMAQDPDDPENVYPVIAMDDLSVFFPGYYVTYDQMGLIGIAEGPDLFNRANDLNLMMTLMKKFVFDHLNEEELYAKVEENTNGFDHPYLIADQDQFDHLNQVWIAHQAKEAGEEYDEQYIDDTLYQILKSQVKYADNGYKRFTTLPDPEKAANYTYLTYAYENTPDKYQELAFEITNPFYGIREGVLYTDSTSYGWDYAGPADENGDYWGKLGVNYNDGYDWAGGRNSHGCGYADNIRELAMGYAITRDIKYAELAYDVMISLCDNNNWHNWSHKHHLSTGEMLMDLGLAYDWLYDIWSEIQYERDSAYSLAYITQQIYRKGIYYSYDISRYSRTSEVWTRDQTSPVNAEGYILNTWNWSKCDINWNCVCNSGIVMGCLAIAGESKKLEGVDYTRDGGDGTDRVLWCMANNLNHISDYGLVQYCPDGSYIEGPSYWGYATHYLSMIMWAVDTAAGDDLGFYEAWGLDKTYYFAVQAEYSTIVNNNPAYRLWSFHDCGESAATDTYDFFFASQMLGDTSLAALRLDRIAMGANISWMDALGYKSEYAGLSLADTPLSLDYQFEACEGVVSRSSWETGHTFSGIMGNKNNFGNHGQMDSGIFTYVDDGYAWFPDMGADEYNVYEYFGYGIRQFYYRNSAEGHNQVILTSQQETVPFGQAYTGYGKITEVYSEDAGMYALLDNTSAYDPYVNFARRGMLVTNNRKTVVIQDEISFKGAESIAWLAHTKASTITLSEDKKTAYVSQVVGGTLEYIRVTLLSNDSKLKFEVMTCAINEDAEGNVTDAILDGIHNSSYSTGMGGIKEYNRQSWRRLVVKAESTLGFTCAVVIEDVRNVEDTTPVSYDFAYMNSWKENGIYETYTGKNTIGQETLDTTITNAKIGDIRTYGVQAKKLLDSGYALTTRIVDFFKNLVRVNSAVNTFRPDSFKNIPQVWEAYEQYLGCLELYNTYSYSINDEFKRVCSIATGLTGI